MKHPRSMLPADVRPRELWGWAMYDFANSGVVHGKLIQLSDADCSGFS